jgi:[ribosomal protein S5]-alanine N-acetyltransferase
MRSHFATPRLLLTSLVLDNDEFILGLVNTPGWLSFIGDRNIRTASDARGYINKINQNPAIKYWVVELGQGKIPIGIITFIKRDYLAFHDIGFAFLPAYAKSGYAFEATSFILKYLAAERIVAHLLATTVPANTDSIRLLAKLGFKPEREIEVVEQKLLVYGLDVELFGKNSSINIGS